MAKAGTPKKDSDGKFQKGSVPTNKIVLPRLELEELYKKYGSITIAKHFGVSKPTVLRNLHEYNIPIKKYPELPEYWRKALMVPKSGTVWSKGLTKENNESLKKISESLKGEKNYQWKPHLHTGELIECACGCGEMILKYDKKGRPRHYKMGHNKEGQFTTDRVSGSNNNHWKGGVTPYHKKLRHSEKYIEWRKAVYIRDYYQCQECGKQHKNIVAHHIKSFVDYPELRFDVNNGIVLCRSCHLKLHQKIKLEEEGINNKDRRER